MRQRTTSPNSCRFLQRMRNKVLLLLLALLAATPPSCAQMMAGDTIVPERVVVKCTSYGVTFMNNLDTYLSGYNYTGSGLYLSRENFRDARTGDHRWKYQTLLTANLGLTSLHNNTQLSGMINYSWSGYHPFRINSRLQLLAGAQAQLGGGALYIPTNGNNLVSVKIRAALAASGMAIYHIPTKRGDCVLRYQLDIPLAGVMFAPEFGQSYYEIFSLGDYGRTVSFSHPANSPSMRNTFSADIPLAFKSYNSTLRLSYVIDILQSDINDIRTHLYNHAFTIGFVKNIYKVKKEDKNRFYSPY